MTEWITFAIVVGLIGLLWRHYKRWEYQDKVRLRLKAKTVEFRSRHPWPPRGMDKLLADVKASTCSTCGKTDCSFTSHLREGYYDEGIT